MVIIMVVVTVIIGLRFNGGVDIISDGGSYCITTVTMMMLRWRSFLMVVMVFKIMVVHKNVIIGMMVIIKWYYQDEGEKGGDLHDGVWWSCQL